MSNIPTLGTTGTRGVAGMPAPGSKRAPSFDPKRPEGLKKFFEKFEEWADACGLDKTTKAKVVVRYTDEDTEEFWQELESYGTDYDKLKQEILGSYATTSLDEKYTVKQLMKYISGTTEGVIDDEEDLNAYYRKYWKMASHLYKQKKISEDQLHCYFWKGLPSKARQAIRMRLTIGNYNLGRDEIPKIDKVREAGKYVYQRGGESDEEAEVEFQKQKKKRRTGKGKMVKRESSEEEWASSSEESSEDERKKKRKEKKMEKEVRTKKVVFEDIGKDDIGELASRLDGLKIRDAAYADTYVKLILAAPALAERLAPPAEWAIGATMSTPQGQQQQQGQRQLIQAPRANTMTNEFACLMCRSPEHRLRACPVASEYARAGRLLIQPNGYHVHTDGSRIGRHPGGFKGAIDEKWGGTLMNTVSTPMNMPITPPARDTPPHLAHTSYITVHDVEEEGFVWGAIAELEKKEEQEVEGFAATRAGKKQGKGKEEKQEEEKRGDERQSGKQKDERKEAAYLPAYRFESKLTDPQVTKEIFDRILDLEVPNIKVKDLLSMSGDLRKTMVENTRTHKTPTVTSTLYDQPASQLNFATPLREVEVLVKGRRGQGKEMGLLDDGSEIVVVRRDLCEEMEMQVNLERRMTMQTANGGREDLVGCVEWLEIEIGGVKTHAHAYVVNTAPYRLLLGRPWQRYVKLGKREREDGQVEVVVTDPTDEGRKVVVTTKERKEKLKKGLMVAMWEREGDEGLKIVGKEDSLTEFILRSSFTYNDSTRCMAYKKVADKVRPVPGTMPREAKVIRRFPENPLDSLPKLSPRPPPFQPGERLTGERMEALGLMDNEFLGSEERLLIAQVLLTNEQGLAWEESEKGRFRDDYFSPVKIPVIDHVPWARKSLPIPPGIRDKVIALIKQKLETGVYEASYSSYRHQWFTVAKKDGNIRIVHNLTPLNAVTIRDSQAPPLVYLYAEQCAARGIYSGLDMFVGYDHRSLAEGSRDFTTFDTPLGTMRLTVLPQGWTGSVGIFHNDVAFLLQHETEHAPNFLDDITLLGPRTRYENEDGTYEVIAENPGIRRFIWEHAIDLNRVLHRLKHAGATVSAKKLQLCQPEIVVVGRKCTYEGQRPDETTVEKILRWPECRNVTEVRGFLGMAGTVRNWIKSFAEVCDPLTKLTRVTKEEFHWGEDQRIAMKEIKERVARCEAIRPINHSLANDIILAVDTSVIAVGYILAQKDEKGQRRPARFGSISWNERISRYSQAKLELYGLFRALNACKLWLVGAKKLVVEVDAKYIKGMLNKPDVHPNAAMNRWISAILMFDFTLTHVPGAKHKGPDGLSRRRRAEESDEEDQGEAEAEEWVDDEVLGCSVWVSKERETRRDVLGIKKGQEDDEGVNSKEKGKEGSPSEVTNNDETKKKDKDLEDVKRFLMTMKLPKQLTEKAKKAFLNRASKFFVNGARLWRKEHGGRHQIVVLNTQERHGLLIAAHDQLGHKGFYATRRTLTDRFWWPTVDSDIRWFIKTCHQCQIRSTEHVVIPPTVQTPAPLFRKAYIDTMHMPPSHGHKYIVQARCSLTGWPEWRALHRETGRTLGSFIFEEILCRWGGLEEIVTDNGTAFIAAVEWLAEKYQIHHIRISAYNSQSNGAVETTHRTIRDALVKTCNGDIRKWYEHVPHVFWADRVTTRRATGYTPYYAVHGVEPLLPFDITEATFLLPPIDSKLSDEDLISLRARALEKRDEDLAKIHERVLAARYASIRDFERRNTNRIQDYNFAPGSLVLVLNKKIEPDVGRKCKPRYFGPMVVIRRLRSGAYCLSELTGAVSKLKFAAFRIIPYHARSRREIQVTEFVDSAELVGVEKEDDEEMGN